MRVYVVMQENGDDATWASRTMVAIYHKKEAAFKERARLEKMDKKLIFLVNEWEVL